MVQIRNHILAMWRGNVSSYLSEEAAVARVQPKHKHLATSAWRFLDREGYINWGVAPAITDREVQEQPEIVVVIGSGLAGVCGFDNKTMYVYAGSVRRAAAGRGACGRVCSR